MSVSFTYDDDDLHNLALVGWKEARGEGSQGMQAVMCVCVNRVGASGFPATLHDVIFQKNAFSSMSRPSDPQYNLEPNPDDLSWRDAQQLALATLNESNSDITNGACYYANLATMDVNGWFARNIVANTDDHPQVATIGRHTFFA